MQNSLIAHIASNFISEYENVANSGIAYLLNEYQASQEALKVVLGVENVPTYYVTEMSTDSNGRPDVTGLDADGNKSVIIEGKFWANLTDNQPNNYLNEITDEGKILFLAPDKRLNSLKLEIEKRTGGHTEKVVLRSWTEFLNQIERVNNKDHNHRLASDLLQMHELCKKMDTEGMPPLSESDLDPMNGRIATNFADIIEECNPILREWEFTDFKGMKTTSTKYGHGFYFRAHSFTCMLTFDSKKWFSRNTHTPFWLIVKDNEWKISERLNHYLNDYDSFNSFANEYGIGLNAGMDKTQAINHIASKAKEVLGFLSIKVTNG
jgi:hypothetical protein